MHPIWFDMCSKFDFDPRAHIYTHIDRHACITTCMHNYIHTYIQTCMHNYIHAYIHTYIHTYIGLLSPKKWTAHTHTDTLCVSLSLTSTPLPFVQDPPFAQLFNTPPSAPCPTIRYTYIFTSGYHCFETPIYATSLYALKNQTPCIAFWSVVYRQAPQNLLLTQPPCNCPPIQSNVCLQRSVPKCRYLSIAMHSIHVDFDNTQMFLLTNWKFCKTKWIRVS